MRRILGLLALLSPFYALADNAPGVEEAKMRWGALTIYMENDKFFAGSDRHYTNGFKLTALSRDLSPELREAPAWARTIADWLPTERVNKDAQADDGTDSIGRKLGFSIGQNIYTPEDIISTSLVPDDRPYAAWLYASLAVHMQTESRLDVFEVSLGIVGESALGREIQNGWHNIIGVDEVFGWDNQLFDEPGLILGYEQRRRFISDGALGGWGADFIPHAGIALGNVATYINAGAQARFGWRLPADFGTALIRPGGDSNSHDATDLAGWSAHAFAGFDARLSAWNIFLDGNTWKDSHSVDKREASVDFFAGTSLRFGRFRCTYTQVYRSKEFYGQGKRDVFGSLALSVLY
jgi:hypothetical protein